MDFNQLFIVKLSISQWSGRKSDKEVEKKVEQDYLTAPGVGLWTKHLIAKEAIRHYTRLTNEARNYVYANTMPYSREGERLITAAHLEKIKWEIDSRRERWNMAVEEFLEGYEGFRDEQAVRLGQMYKSSDYPSTDHLRSKFSFSVSYYPVPTSNHIVAEIEKEIAEEIKTSLERENELLKKAMYKDLWDRLYDAVQHIVERLSSVENVFRDTLIGNVSDLCDILKTLNPNGEGELEMMRARIAEQLAGYSPRMIRDNESIRKEVRDKAAVILEQIEEGRRKIRI